MRPLHSSGQRSRTAEMAVRDHSRWPVGRRTGSSDARNRPSQPAQHGGWRAPPRTPPVHMTTASPNRSATVSPLPRSGVSDPTPVVNYSPLARRFSSAESRPTTERGSHPKMAQSKLIQFQLFMSAMSFDEAQRLASRLRDELGRAIIGQDNVVQEILTAFYAGGHCLLRGVPGLAKTLLIKTLAQAVHLKFNRVQFTPDLMPSDIIGTEVIEEDRGTGRREIRFIPGPVFANVILADEINRTPPKTQAALLEAMQEYQVTVNGVRYELERPLFVLATQNPIEQEGTYPLPEAQLDRFMFNVVIDYPSAAEEHQILASTTTDREPVITPVATAAQIEAMRHLVRDIPAASNVIDYALRIVRASRPAGDVDDHVPPVVRQFVKWGAGPRAGQALVLGGKARALLDGRSVASLDDVRAVALPVLRHRVLLNFQAEADGIDADQIVNRLLEAVRVP